MARSGTRVARLERAIKPPGRRGRTAIADVWGWPPEARAALETACKTGDLETQADLVEAHEGQRPSLGGPRVSLILAWPPEPGEGEGGP